MSNIKIDFSNKKYEISFDFDRSILAAVKAIPGRKFDWDSKSWSVPTNESLALKSFVDSVKEANHKVNFCDQAQAAFDQTVQSQEKTIQQSLASDADIDIPAPEGLEYKPFQKAGVQYMLNHEHTLLADDMGLGKTIQAIGYCNATKAEKIIIICPASLRLNWLREFEKWDVQDRSFFVVRDGKDIIPKKQPGVIIINYDIVQKFDLKAFNFDVLICDEAHYLKNKNTIRSKEVFGYWDKETKKTVEGIRHNAKHILLLTGTPITNRPIDAYNLLRVIAPNEFGNWKMYTDRYCDAQKNKYGKMDVSGSSNLTELQQRLRATCMVRRMKTEVLKELPPKFRKIVEIEHSCVKQESKKIAGIEKTMQEIAAKIELAKCCEESEEEYKNIISALNSQMKVQFQDIAKIRHETALKKVPVAIDYINDQLESSPKIGIFAHHLDVIDQLVEAFPGCACITGSHSLQDRQDAVDRFQNDPNCRVFIGNIKAAGVGLTLTAASHCVFIELDFVPANMSQAEDRFCRMGQQNSVLVEQLVLSGSYDAVMAKKLIAKQEIIDQALDNDIDPESLKTTLMPVTENYVETPKKDIEEQSITISDADADKALTGIKMIAALCDGASAVDGMGFSKIDVKIGMSLASFSQLSKKQAVIAIKLCKKYRRQIGHEISFQ